MELPKLQPEDIIELFFNPELRYICDDEVEQFENIVHPDGDNEFEQNHISRVWRLQEDNYICVYKKVEIKGAINEPINN